MLFHLIHSKNITLVSYYKTKPILFIMQFLKKQNCEEKNYLFETVDQP